MRKKKQKIAIVSLTSDEGCQFVLLDLAERLFEFLGKVDLIDFSLIEDRAAPKGRIDIAFVEGVPITKEDFAKLKKARENSRILVAMGNCAALGGIPEIKNYRGKEKTIRYIYKDSKNIENPDIKPIDKFVKVDYVIPGCPIDGEEFLKIANALIEGKAADIPQCPVCTECSYKGTPRCFLARKRICLGLISQAGCGAICPRNEIPCYGCRGIIKKANVKGFLAVLAKLGGKEDVKEALELFGIKDDIDELLK